MLQEPTSNGVAGLVERDRLLLLGRYDLVRFETTYNTISGRFKVENINLVLVTPSGDNGLLVADVGDISPSKTWGKARKASTVIRRVAVKGQALQVNLEDLFTALNV